jgi:exodeoxyribonuclease VII large subunit
MESTNDNRFASGKYHSEADAVYHLRMNELTYEPASRVYTPSELNQEVKLHLEAGFPRVLIEAEISNLSKPASGHLYFSLKDRSAQIRCAMFRSSVARCRISPENGKMVIARGRISLYEARGDYQFIVDGLKDAGEGLLQQQFEALKKKLDAEGLFDKQLKKPLPAFPFKIGVITSPSGAAVRDVLQVLSRRWPAALVKIYPASVQGAQAPADIRAALALANREDWAEVLILCRGGGSIEDLQAFNEEAVARSVAQSTIPLVSAVGHETDFSICDFVADLRAPTPSAAAELATPDRVQLNISLERQKRLLEMRAQSRVQRDMQKLDHLAHRLKQRDPAVQLLEQQKQLIKNRQSLGRALETRIRECSSHLAGLSTRVELQHPRKKLEELRQRLVNNKRLSESLCKQKIESSHMQLNDLGRTLHAVSPLATMGRGYAVLSDTGTGTIITEAEQVGADSKVSAQLANGRLYCTVDNVTSEALDTGEEKNG